MSSVDNFDAAAFLGQQVGTCTIMRELARGGMGIVFIAYQQTLKRRIAIKVTKSPSPFGTERISLYSSVSREL